MRLLVVGANGLLGSNIVNAGQRRNWEISGTYHSARPDFNIPLTQFDLREYRAFDEVLSEHNPDIVVNCAAITDVDGCETNPEAAKLVNRDAAGGLAAHCEQADVTFVHVSTDYVFDGAASKPYRETAEPNPVQVYGKSKLAGERAAQAALESVLLPRLSFVWGIHRSTDELTGFPSWVRNKLQADEVVSLFTDQWVTPTRAGQAAETILDLISQDASGRYHVACTSCATPYEFGNVIVERTNSSSDLLREGSIDKVNRNAERPKYSCLSVEKVEAELGRAQPTLREDVDAVWDCLG